MSAAVLGQQRPPEHSTGAVVPGDAGRISYGRKVGPEADNGVAAQPGVPVVCGLDISSKIWDDSTFSKNRERRFDKSDIMERLFDDTVKTAIFTGNYAGNLKNDDFFSRLLIRRS